jgi:hypothetical protein
LLVGGVLRNVGQLVGIDRVTQKKGDQDVCLQPQFSVGWRTTFRPGPKY